MSIAYIGLGSNLGDRQKNIETAIEKIRLRKTIEVKEISSVIETEPAGDIDQPKFLNAACMLETALYPDELLDTLKSIEREMGRDKDSSKRVSNEEKLKMLQQGNLDIDSTIRLEEEQQRKEELSREQKKWGPRIIDLDILFYDDIIMKGNNLVIPHALLHERTFVLKPLAEIASNFMHPALNKSINDLLLERIAKNQLNPFDEAAEQERGQKQSENSQES